MGGAERLIRGRLGIMATGVSYGLHKGLGFRVPDRFLSGAQVEVMFDEASAEVEVYFGNHVAPESFAWVIPFRRHGVAMAKIGLLSDKDAVRYLNTFLQSPLVAPRIRPGHVCRYLRRPVPVWPLSDTVGDRILTVGDAAGLVKPTTGGGVYYSLLSAELAAEAMGEALDAGDGSARFLSRYQTAWRTAIWPEIRMGGLFRSFAAHLSDAQIDEAFALVGREPMAQLIRDHGSFNWHRGLILALWQSRGMRGFLWRVLMRRGGQMVGLLRHPVDESCIRQPPEESAAVD
jgi:flavin-dependent dehydrogenase